MAVDEGKVLGTTMGGFDGHRGWLYSVAVDPSFRRRSIATQLVRRVEAALLAMGCRKLNLQVRTPNPEAICFYRHLGYQVEERVSMGKTLDRDAGPRDESW